MPEALGSRRLPPRLMDEPRDAARYRRVAAACENLAKKTSALGLATSVPGLAWHLRQEWQNLSVQRLAQLWLSVMTDMPDSAPPGKGCPVARLLPWDWPPWTETGLPVLSSRLPHGTRSERLLSAMAVSSWGPGSPAVTRPLVPAQPACAAPGEWHCGLGAACADGHVPRSPHSTRQTSTSPARRALSGKLLFLCGCCLG